MKTAITLILFLSAFVIKAQYPPAAGLSGSTAIHADSNVFVGWATSCSLIRGSVDISNSGLGYTDFGNYTDALNKADNNVVSLGDGGIAELNFQTPLRNGPGPDFAVFENSFGNNFLELAYVSVSSNGLDFFTFPSESLTQTDSQITTFGTLDPVKIHNLAGKYAVMYGTPFDLDDIPDNALLDKNNIGYVRIKDVTGSIIPSFANYDSHGRIINDPWPTPFNSCGFDLDAVGIINSAANVSEGKTESELFIYPVPCSSVLRIKPGTEFSEGYSVILYDNFGRVSLIHNDNRREAIIDISEIPSGLYEVKITGNGLIKSDRIVKN